MYVLQGATMLLDAQITDQVFRVNNNVSPNLTTYCEVLLCPVRIISTLRAH